MARFFRNPRDSWKYGWMKRHGGKRAMVMCDVDVGWSS